MSHYVVVGGDSLIGAELVRSLRSDGHSVIETTRRPERVDAECRYCDLRLGVPLYDWENPATVFLCAAVTGENCTADSRAVNVDTAVSLAAMFHGLGAHVVFPSTTRPPEAGEYARQKRDAEESLLAMSGVSVVRLGKVLTPGFLLFAKWAESLRRGEPIECRADLRISPVTLAWAARHLRLASEHSGLCSIVAERSLTYHEIGLHLAQRIGASVRLVRPVIADPPASADQHRNLYSRLPSPWLAVEESLRL